jgi:hypothetical protein
MRSLTITPREPFDLASARDVAGGFQAAIGATASADKILMTLRRR